jgi:type IV pilus assembly protein PilB
MRIGEALLQEGLINSEELGFAIKEQEKSGDRLGDILVGKGFVLKEEMAPFLAKYFNIPYLNLRDNYKDIKTEVIRHVPENLARRFTVLPVSLEDNILTVAMSDPLNFMAVDTIKIKTGFKIKRVVSSEKEIIEATEYCYHQSDRMQKYIDDFVSLEEVPDKIEDFDKLRNEASDPPVVQYVNSLIIQAVNNSVSDIHLKPKQDKVELCFRIDGVLYEQDSPPKSMLPAITTRIKILSNLDISERRRPQDGRFKTLVGQNEIDVRTSCFPTIYGESIVMRVLNTTSPLHGLNKLGFLPEDLIKYRNLIQHPYGLILITGPTGSGKTTTLYCSLNEIKSSEKNMITLEDPVEYRLPFLVQSQINPAIGFDFAKGLRSIVRQDPDIIMVGEIRDKETAEVAIHAALTGHLVFSTLHTNDAASATMRLINMGVEPFLITSSLLGVLAQRLIRCTCNNCRDEYVVKKDVLDKLLVTKDVTKYYKGSGCPKCLNTGYKARMGIFELLIIDEEIRNLILTRASREEVKSIAIKNGMKTLRVSGIEKMKAGLTTPEEVLRVTQTSEENGNNGHNGHIKAVKE